MINQQINDDYGEHDQLRPTPSHNRYLKSSNSTNNLHQSVKHSGYLYLKSKKDLRKWQRKFFIWNGETLTYQDTLGDPIKWSINLNQIVSVRVKARNPQTSRSSISKLFTHCEVSSTETVEIRLIDESVVEIAGKTSEENQVWVDVLNRAVNVEWLRAFRECIVPGNRHRDAHVFFSASDSESEDGVIIDGADETSVSEQSVNSKIGKYIPLKKPGIYISSEFLKNNKNRIPSSNVIGSSHCSWTSNKSTKIKNHPSSSTNITRGNSEKILFSRNDVPGR